MKFCSKSSLKVYCGVLVLLMVTSSWVGSTQLLRLTMTFQLRTEDADNMQGNIPLRNITSQRTFSAPFFTCWFVTAWSSLFFPLYFVCSSVSYVISGNDCWNTMKSKISFQIKDNGFTTRLFLIYSLMFCLLSVATTYLYVTSLRVLGCTVVTAIFATNACFVYLLSWVFLHEQFVGIRIFAIILSITGISLIAYIDGVKDFQTLISVILASGAAAVSAIFKVLFKKVMGEVNFPQVSLFFSTIGILNTVLLWPLVIILCRTEIESIDWLNVPWIELSGAAILSLVSNILANFSILVTYENFIVLGLITAIPASAGLDILVHGEQFVGMKLAGIIFISCGFIMVFTPNNWTSAVRNTVRGPDSTDDAAVTPSERRTRVEAYWEDNM